jgi:hypothetical protein
MATGLAGCAAAAEMISAVQPILASAAPMSAAEFLSECDRLGYIYYTETRDPGGPSVMVILPEHDEKDVALGRWFELLKQFDDQSPEFGRYLLNNGRTQHAVERIRAGTFIAMPDFENNWDARLYVDYMLSNGGHCDSFYRRSRLAAYVGWIPELVGSDEPRKNNEYLAELKRRGRAHEVPDGISVDLFMDSLYQGGQFKTA